MNPPLTLSAGLTQLKLLTSQTGNFTFTDDEITQALTTAWNDDFNCKIVWDSSLSYTSTTWQYAIPATIDVVQDIYYQATTTSKPERLDTSLYEVVNGNIQFLPKADKWLMTGQALFIRGRKKLATTDSLTSTQGINYVLYTAATILLEQLVLKQAFVFLRNDTSPTDISRAISTIQSAALRYKQALLREFETA